MKNNFLALFSLSLASSLSAFAVETPESVSVIDYFLNQAHQRGQCLSLSSSMDVRRESEGLVAVTLKALGTRLEETFVTSPSASACVSSKGNRGEDLILCQGAIRSERNGIPEDHREIPTSCSRLLFEVTNDSNELRNTIGLSQINWWAYRGKSCEAALVEAERDSLLFYQDIRSCAFDVL